MDKLKYFKSEFNMQGRRGEMMLRGWAVREYFVSGAYLKFYTQHLYGV